MKKVTGFNSVNIDPIACTAPLLYLINVLLPSVGNNHFFFRNADSITNKKKYYNLAFAIEQLIVNVTNITCKIYKFYERKKIRYFSATFGN